jgi:hypothetical protein
VDAAPQFNGIGNCAVNRIRNVLQTRFLSLNVNILENEKTFDANRPMIEQMVAWVYEVTSTFEPLMAKAIPHTQTFQTVDVAQDKLVLRAFLSEGEQLNGFQLEKKNGRSVYSELAKPSAAGTAPGE